MWASWSASHPIANEFFIKNISLGSTSWRQKISKIWIFLSGLHQGLFLSLRFWVTGSFNVAIPTLDSREAPYSGSFCEEKQRPGVEGVSVSCPVPFLQYSINEYGRSFLNLEIFLVERIKWFLQKKIELYFRLTRFCFFFWEFLQIKNRINL